MRLILNAYQGNLFVRQIKSRQLGIDDMKTNLPPELTSRRYTDGYGIAAVILLLLFILLSTQITPVLVLPILGLSVFFIHKQMKRCTEIDNCYQSRRQQENKG